MRFIYLLFIYAACWVLMPEASAQVGLSEIKFRKKCTKKICNYVDSFKKRGISLFNQLEPSMYDTSSLSSFSTHVGYFFFDAPVEKVWKVASVSNPAEIWIGKILSLSFVYDKNCDKILFPSELCENSLSIEQIYFITLKYLKGMFVLPTALKVTKIDSDEKTIEFTYLRGGKSEGKQSLQFLAESDNKTQIIHTTYYHSGSRLRDRRLYPHFHQKAISELHENMNRKVTNMN